MTDREDKFNQKNSTLQLNAHLFNHTEDLSKNKPLYLAGLDSFKAGSLDPFNDQYTDQLSPTRDKFNSKESYVKISSRSASRKSRRSGRKLS